MKKFVTLLVSFAIVLSLSVNTLAANPSFEETSDSTLEMTRADIAQYALN